MSGYVYILTNPSFKDNWVKIGKSSRPVDVRSKELDNTAVPLPFEIYAVMKTEKYNEAEKQLHSLIDLVNPSMRIRKGREFFNVPPETALDIFRQCALTLGDAEITVMQHREEASSKEKYNGYQQSSRPQRAHGTKSKKLTFRMLNIPVGSELTFVENSSIKARVINDNSMVVLEDGTRATLTGATRIIKRRLGTPIPSEAYQGGKFWMYNGRPLTVIRSESENQSIYELASSLN